MSFQRDRHPKHLRCQRTENGRQLPYCLLLLPGSCPLRMWMWCVWFGRWRGGRAVVVVVVMAGRGRGGGACLWTGRGTGAPCAVAVGEEVNWARAEPRRCLGYWQVGTWGLLQDRNTLPEAWLPPPPACLRGKEGYKKERGMKGGVGWKEWVKAKFWDSVL